MRILIVSLALFSLASCTLGGEKTITPSASQDHTGTTTESTSSGTQKTVFTSVQPDAYVSVKYTLRVGSSTGKIYETNDKSAAEAAGMTGSQNYDPLKFMIGAGKMIPGFEKGILGMKTGEKKTIEVPPELGYGTGPTLYTIDKSQLAPIFTIVEDVDSFSKAFTQTVTRDKLTEEFKNAKVGDTLTGTNNATAKVIQATATDITIEAYNTGHPFYNKKLKVGMTGEDTMRNAVLKVLKLSGTGVTIEVTNKNSPFYNKKFAVGESITVPTGIIEIKEIKEDTIVIGESSPLTGKTLFFDVEVVDIK